MKPRTKEQRRLLEIAQKFPLLTKKQKLRIKRHAFSLDAIESRGRIKCACCGHEWRVENAGELAKATCPRCKKKLDVNHHKLSLCEESSFILSEACGNYQVFRFWMAQRAVSFKDGISYRTNPLGAIFLNEKGKLISYTIGYSNFYWRLSWRYGSEIELRRDSKLLGGYGAGAFECKSVMPLLRRNGFNENTSSLWPQSVAQKLLTDNAFESLWKQGQIGVCDYKMRNRWASVKEEAQQIVLKIATRHGHLFKTADEWSDMLDYVHDLLELGKDIRNPKILFPENFQEAHAVIRHRVERKRQEERHRRERIEEIEKAKRDKKRAEWLRDYELRFSGLAIAKDGFVVTPLISLSDFQNEADDMHHCIVTYYGKVNTLLLSIKRNGRRMETAEINLLTNEIVQCRGHCNAPSEWHSQIENVLRSSMDIFKKFSERKTYETTKNLPAVLSQWQAA